MGDLVTLVLLCVAAWLGWRWLKPRLGVSREADAESGDATSRGDVARIRGPGEYSVEVVGESFHAAAFRTLIKRHKPGDLDDEWLGDALLILENDNPHDRNAVSVHIDDLKVGHLSRDMAKEFRTSLRRDGLGHLTSIAVGARLYFGGDDGRHSVSIDLPTK